MFKKVLKIIGSFFLVLIILFICMGIYLAVNTSKYTEMTQPYFKKNIPAIVSWDFSKLRPLLTSKLLKEFETKRGQKVYKIFSKLGSLKSFKEPHFVGARTGVTTSEGVYDSVDFSILGHFEAGDAEILITLLKEEDIYLIHNIKINSDVFFE